MYICKILILFTVVELFIYFFVKSILISTLFTLRLLDINPFSFRNEVVHTQKKRKGTYLCKEESKYFIHCTQKMVVFVSEIH